MFIGLKPFFLEAGAGVGEKKYSELEPVKNGLAPQQKHLIN